MVAQDDGDADAAMHRRSSGPPSADQNANFRAKGEPMAFDPVWIETVPCSVIDDVDVGHAPPKAGWPSMEDARAGGASHRFSFRPWHAADAGLFRRLLDDDDVWRHLPNPRPDPFTDEAANDLIALSNESTHHEVRAILWEGVPVGQVRLEYRPDRVAEVSYWLGRDHWGRGIAGAVVADYVARATASGRFSAITARVHRLNVASQRVLQRAGLMSCGPLNGSRDWLFYRKQV